MNDYFHEIREKRESFKNNKDILEILDTGNRRARQVVRHTLEKVRDVMKLRTWQ